LREKNQAVCDEKAQWLDEKNEFMQKVNILEKKQAENEIKLTSLSEEKSKLEIEMVI
jgi:hypothetical protein